MCAALDGGPTGRIVTSVTSDLVGSYAKESNALISKVLLLYMKAEVSGYMVNARRISRSDSSKSRFHSQS